MTDLIQELTELRAEAPDARLFFVLRYPSGRTVLEEATDADRLSAFRDQVRYGAGELLTIYALSPGEREPTARSYGTLEEEVEGLALLVAQLRSERESGSIGVEGR